MKLRTKLFISIDFIIISFLIVVYIPSFKEIQKKMINDYFIKDKLYYMSYVLYDDDKVEALKNDYTETKVNLEEEPVGDSYVKLQDKRTYDNIYDQLILSRDTGNDDYKVIKTLIGGYPAYIVAIYHPEDVRLLRSKAFNTKDSYSGLSTVKQMTKAAGAVVGINGGSFKSDSRTFGIDTPNGYIIKDGKININ